LVPYPGMMDLLYGEQFSLDGIMRLIQERAGHRHPGAFKDGIPARLLLVEPAPDALAVGFPGALCHAVGKVAEPLPQRTHPQALARARPVGPGVEPRAPSLAPPRP